LQKQSEAGALHKVEAHCLGYQKSQHVLGESCGLWLKKYAEAFTQIGVEGKTTLLCVVTVNDCDDFAVISIGLCVFLHLHAHNAVA